MRDNLLICVLGHDGHYMAVNRNMEHNINIQKVETVYHLLMLRSHRLSIEIFCC